MFHRQQQQPGRRGHGKTKASGVIMKNKLKNNIKLIMFVNYAGSDSFCFPSFFSMSATEKFSENHLANILSNRGHFSSRFIRSQG